MDKYDYLSPIERSILEGKQIKKIIEEIVTENKEVSESKIGTILKKRGVFFEKDRLSQLIDELEKEEVIKNVRIDEIMEGDQIMLSPIFSPF